MDGGSNTEGWLFSVRHDVDWSKIDPKAINDGFQEFWGNCELDGWERNRDGAFKRDGNGKLLPIRSTRPRIKPKGNFDYFENL